MSFLFPNEHPAKAPEGSALIATVFDPLKTAIIKGILESAEIPFLVKERGSGSSLSIIMGSNYLGTDIYVPDECADRALELIAPLFEDEENDDDEAEDDNEDNEDNEDNDAEEEEQ
mgnify:FL=1